MDKKRRATPYRNRWVVVAGAGVLVLLLLVGASWVTTSWAGHGEFSPGEWPVVVKDENGVPIEGARAIVSPGTSSVFWNYRGPGSLVSDDRGQLLLKTHPAGGPRYGGRGWSLLWIWDIQQADRPTWEVAFEAEGHAKTVVPSDAIVDLPSGSVVPIELRRAAAPPLTTSQGAVPPLLGTPSTFGDMVRHLRQLPSDEARWQDVKPVLEERRYQYPGETTGEVVAANLLSCHFVSYQWVLAFPGITKHTTLSLEDLELLGNSLGWEEPVVAVVGGEYGAPPEPIGVTRGDVARLWLRQLTGRDFQNRTGFREWLETNRTRLVWQVDRGAFSLQGNPATGPTSQEVQRQHDDPNTTNDRTDWHRRTGARGR